MNSEITNVSKLASVTVLNNKQDNLKPAAVDANIVTERPNATVSAADLKTQAAALKADAQETSLEVVKSAMAQGSSILQATNRNLEFQVDDSTKKVVVKIVDSESGDVVRQIPSEQMLAFIKRMQELEGKKGTMLQDQA
jgi:flagellar protein FlaG